MQLIENAPLAKYTTFYIGGPAQHLLFAQTDEQVMEGIKIAKQNNWPVFILGGGSNVLISDSGFKGLVIRIETVGIDIAEQTDEYVILKVASGEVWDDVVRLAVEENWWGIENLSHIPGFTGAFAVQNVGAYGQEASQVVTKLDCYDRTEDRLVTLSAEQINFSYRKSIFNTTAKDRYVILHTYLKLSKQPSPNLSYRDLAERFNGNPNPDIAEIRKEIVKIRNLKFPFPDHPEAGNAGSFFRGPLLDEKHLDDLIKNLDKNLNSESAQRLAAIKPKLKVPQGYKTPGAFLVDTCGLKGWQNGGVKVNEPQPAIIVNFSGHGTAREVLELYRQVSKIVYQQTGVRLEIEPELIGFSSEEISKFTAV